MLGWLGRQQRHLRAARVHGLVVLAQIEIIDAGAGERDRAIDCGCVDRHAIGGGRGQRLSAGSRRRAPLSDRYPARRSADLRLRMVLGGVGALLRFLPRARVGAL